MKKLHFLHIKNNIYLNKPGNIFIYSFFDDVGLVPVPCTAASWRRTGGGRGWWWHPSGGTSPLSRQRIHVCDPTYFLESHL